MEGVFRTSKLLAEYNVSALRWVGFTLHNLKRNLAINYSLHVIYMKYK